MDISFNSEYLRELAIKEAIYLPQFKDRILNADFGKDKNENIIIIVQIDWVSELHRNENVIK